MNVLIACEYSGIVREAFSIYGHYALSVDLLPSEIPSDHHYQGNVEDVLHDTSIQWDLMVAFPPCTYLAVSGSRWFHEPGYDPDRLNKRVQAAAFFRLLADAPIAQIAIENPVGYMSTAYKKPTQIIQPYYFGDPTRKTTCLWLKNLPRLRPTNMVEPNDAWERDNGINRATRSHKRSRTFPGVAKAMASQWAWRDPLWVSMQAGT